MRKPRPITPQRARELLAMRETISGRDLARFLDIHGRELEIAQRLLASVETPRPAPQT